MSLYLFRYSWAIGLDIAKHTKVDMIWVAGRSPTLVSYSLRGVAMNLKATTLTYLAIVRII
jgi:steroid 5-alpha reductase family enzyme